MKLPDSVYNIMKWITMIVLPALATAYVGLSAIWGWPYADEVAKTTAVICTLLGALLGISTAQYNKDASGTIYTPATWEEVDNEDE
jgi:hypothetical protein